MIHHSLEVFAGWTLRSVLIWPGIVVKDMFLFCEEYSRAM
ncbi:hypothetical protein M140_3171 [Bacteroides fragilis str. S38L3]|nr:hypothetical protein M140_3171 [Bacteroides fragilis str. S38L3]